MVMHHIASDGWSMGILMRELSHFYETEISGSSKQSAGAADSVRRLCGVATGVAAREGAQPAARLLETTAGRCSDSSGSSNRPTTTGGSNVSRSKSAAGIIPGAHPRSKSLESARESLAVHDVAGGVPSVVVSLHSAKKTSSWVLRSLDAIEEKLRTSSDSLSIRSLCERACREIRRSWSLLRRVREVALEAYEHQDLPFERLVEDLQSERSLSHNPLFQVMFVLQNAPGSPLKLSGIEANRVRLVTETAHFDLTMSITERRSGADRKTSLTRPTFLKTRRLRGCWDISRFSLRGLSSNRRSESQTCPLLKEAERRQLLEWNQTEHPSIRRVGIFLGLFEAQVERTPEAVALEFEGEALAYSELNRRANQLARRLRQMGVGPDVLVGLYMERSVETMVAVLGTLKAGGAYVPLDTAYPQDRLAFMLADANPRVVISQQRLRNRIPDPISSVLCLDAESESVSTQSSENLRPENVPESLAYVIYTSGSTGRPKGVAMTRQALVNLVLWQCGVSNARESSRTLQFTSLSFDVSFQEIFSTWCSGGALVLIQEQVRRDSLALIRSLQENRINRLFLPFIALEHLAEAAASCEVLPSTLKEVYTAGEQLIITPKILRLFEKLPGCSLHNHYGPSESHVVTAYTLPTLRSQWQPRPPIGCPIANCQVYILDTHLRPVPVGVAGELFIGGDCLARGYLDRPELTAERFLPNPLAPHGASRLYKTGDLVRYLHDGNIEFLGRSDHQVKLRGYRIELGEIESVLAQHPGVAETVVVVREDVPGDQRLVAYIVGHDGHSSEVGELRSFLSKRLPDYMVPSAYVFLEALPLTPSGKVDRRKLPAVSAAERGVSEGYLGPRDELERKLTRIWEELLGVGRIGIKDNFFDLGGHSLLAMRLIARVEQELSRTFSLADLFQSPTIEGLARELWGQGNDCRTSIGSALFGLRGTKPPVFVHGGSFELSRHLGEDQPCYGLEPHGQEGGGRLRPLRRWRQTTCGKSGHCNRRGPTSSGAFPLVGWLRMKWRNSCDSRGKT